MKTLSRVVRGLSRPFLAFTAATAAGITVWSAESGGPDASTQEMGRLLQELASKVDPRTMPFQVDDRKADLLADDLAIPGRPTLERLQLRFSYASALLRAGKTK